MCWSKCFCIYRKDGGIKKTVDFIEVNGRHVVVKQIHQEPCGYYQFGNKIQAEMNDYECLSAIGISMPQMLEVDIENERIVKEYIAGDTVYELVRKECLPETCLRQVNADTAFDLIGNLGTLDITISLCYHTNVKRTLHNRKL